MPHFVFVNQFFYPDESATSMMLTDCVRAVARLGLDVDVVCSRGGYIGAEGGEGAGKIDGVRIQRVAAPGFTRGAGFHKVLSYACFAIGAARRVLRCGRGDTIVSMTTPPLLAVLGRLAQIMGGARHVIWEMDVYPDVAVALGVLRWGTLAERIIGLLSDWPRRHADAVVALGPCMRERLLARGVPAERLHVAENWADGREIQPRAFPERDTLRVLYSGNLGLAHDLETVCGVMEALAGDRRFRFCFAGGGPQRGALERLCNDRGFGNVEFRGYSARHELSSSLAACHVGLVTQKAATVGAVVPSKVYGLMAAGRPVLYVGPASGTPAWLIRRFRCGWQIDPGDVEGLVGLLRRLADDIGEVEDAGARGYAAFREHYDRPAGVERICRIVGATGIDAGAVPVEIGER